jgi:hypothetical protein
MACTVDGMQRLFEHNCCCCVVVCYHSVVSPSMKGKLFFGTAVTTAVAAVVVVVAVVADDVVVSHKGHPNCADTNQFFIVGFIEMNKHRHKDMFSYLS